MIVSAIDGRIRYINPGLKNKTIADTVINKLKEIDGIKNATINPITGSLLVVYVNSTPTSKTIQNVLNGYSNKLKRKNYRPLYRKKARKKVKLVMLGTIVSSILALFADSDKWHYRLGSIFLGTLSLHLYQNYRRILK